MKRQINLFTNGENKQHWKGMPEYISKDLHPFKSVIVHFRNQNDLDSFLKLVDQKPVMYKKIKPSMWYPKKEIRLQADKTWVDKEKPKKPKYPIYIISKGRWESRLTSKALERMNTPYKIVVEPQEYDNYASVIDKKKILTLPFGNRGEGSIPARNWIWEHSIKKGAKRHWILDDNIHNLLRRNDNLRRKVMTGTIFRVAEDFVDRYENVALAGAHYDFCVPNRDNRPPFLLNSRIYSCILIKNNLPYRWRGRYNEDTDLSLRVLKDGWCTMLFHFFLQEKEQTMTMKGGNTDKLYKDDGRLKMVESLIKQHPDVVRKTWKFSRWQHQVNYKPFKKNKLIKKKGLKVSKGINNYGMILKTL